MEVEEQEDLGNMEIEKIEALKDKHIDSSRIFYEKSGYSYVTYYYLIDVVCTSKYNVKAVCRHGRRFSRSRLVQVESCIFKSYPKSLK